MVPLLLVAESGGQVSEEQFVGILHRLGSIVALQNLSLASQSDLLSDAMCFLLPGVRQLDGSVPGGGPSLFCSLEVPAVPLVLPIFLLQYNMSFFTMKCGEGLMFSAIDHPDL